MIPILICVPFWQGDKSQAIDVLRLIAGLQAVHAGTAANIMLVGRQDCPIDPNMIKIISPKFNILTFNSTSPLRGWPAGPNGMFGSTMINICNMGLNKYECVFWMEPDCIPIRPNWFWDLVLEWRKKHPAAKVIGCRSDCNGDGSGDHISGCAIYDPNITRIIPHIATCDNVAWDYHLRAKIVAVGAHTPLIQNWYKARNAHDGILDQQGVVLIHGFKDRSMAMVTARRYNIKLD